jgi:HlyD family secretion protein
VKTTEAQVAAAGLALQTTEAEVEAAAAVLRQFGNAATGAPAAIVLRSPINGAILRVHQESEALVAAGTPLIEVGDPGDLEVVVDLLSTDAVKVKPGLRVVISGWGGAETLGGRVRLVEPGGFTKISALGVEEQRVNIVADLDDPRQASPLGDAYRVDVSVIVWERSGILKVPTSALFRAGDKWSVFAARDGVARQTAIQVGQRNALEAEVLAGLSEHDLVIVHPGEAVADGVRIIQRE